MINEETTALTALIGQIWPSMRIEEFTADAWHLILEDLPYDLAQLAVATLAKARPGYISPYDIRRQAAKTAGLLAPDEADALGQGVTVAGNLGTGASLLPGAVQDAYWAMGGSQGFAAPPAILRPQFGRVYRDAVTAREEQLLGGNLGLAIEEARTAELTARAAEAVERVQTAELKARDMRAIEGTFQHVEPGYVHVGSKWSRGDARVPEPLPASPDDDPDLDDALEVLRGLGGHVHAYRAAARAELEREGARLSKRTELIRAAALATRPENGA